MQDDALDRSIQRTFSPQTQSRNGSITDLNEVLKNGYRSK